MKNLSILFLFFFLAASGYAQKKNGIVYSEHEYIEKTKQLWSAFVNADNDAYASFFADSVYEFNNEVLNIRTKNKIGDDVEWTLNYDNLKIEDQSGATPDAIKYDNGDFWVADWILLKGTHKKTGINIDLPIHDLYKFNEQGKISSIHQYYDNSVFEEIANSQTTKENGTVYINHPFINTVRKIINAFCAKDLETWSDYFAPKAIFSNTTLKMNKTVDCETRKKELEAIFSSSNNIKMEQTGYPDCIYYAKGDFYVVYSWWILFYTSNDNVTRKEIPIMYSHNFDSEGKITMELGYYSSNQFE